MKIISFAWTTEALLAGLKTVTRRFWSDSYAEKFKEGDRVQAWDKSPRFGGCKVAEIRLTCDPYKEKLAAMPEDDVAKEGGLWASKNEFINCMGGPNEEPWVVRFELVAVEGS